MTLTDALQITATVLVAIALIFNMLQVREVTRQTKALDASVTYNAYHAISGSRDDPRVTFFLNDPVLLAWHLRSRGFRTSSDTENKRRLYALLKLNVHEANFVNYGEGTLPAEHWAAWQNVIEADFMVPVFREVWQTARPLYSVGFGAYVDELVLRTAAVRAGPAA